jgi:hypothetical protein
VECFNNGFIFWGNLVEYFNNGFIFWGNPMKDFLFDYWWFELIVACKGQKFPLCNEKHVFNI